MEIILNGKPHHVEGEARLLEVLHSLNLPNLEQGVAVCLNGEVLSRADWGEARLCPHDNLEIVTAAQGG